MKILSIIILLICSLYQLRANEINNSVSDSSSLMFEYKLYTESDILGRDSLLLQRALQYKNLGNYTAAIHMLQRITTDWYACRYEKALLYYLAADYYTSMQIINMFSLQHSDKSGVMKQILVLDILEYYGIDSCSKHIAKAGIDSAEFGKFLIPERAETLSLWFPGLGQFYAHKPQNGIVSFLLVGGFATLTTACVISGLYVTAIIWGVYPTLRFYGGGARNSYYLAKKYNTVKTEMRKQSLRRQIVE